jgi:FtsP/CotA-like multicopper oxidase with cupredoxin domain
VLRSSNKCAMVVIARKGIGMKTRRLIVLTSAVLTVAAISWSTAPGRAQPQTAELSIQSDKSTPAGVGRRRGTTLAQREAERVRQGRQKTGVRHKFAGVNPETAALSPLARRPHAPAKMSAPLSTPDYFGVANYANSPLPQLDATGAIIPGTGIKKFVDTLPGLCGVSPWGTSGANGLGQCIPIATPDTTTFPGSDFYRIGLQDYSQQMHTDLPSTKIRGYVQLDANGNPIFDPVTGKQQYMGPLILATRDKPVRLLFQNRLANDLFIPVDPTYMGAGMVDNGATSALASQKRATIHLHGGNTPWISDGTPHQWITPAGDAVPNAEGFAKGFSFQNVPDMVGAGSLIPAPSLTDGLGTYYFTNQQSGRLMFYHDHAYGITRLNVYAGEAAPYLLVDPAQEDALAAATVPGTIGATPDLAHLVPLVIQDKTFVPDNGAPGGQLAATDPTWDVANFGGAGSLWFPHVYMPNQNPSVASGASAYGRWDYGPWFWPPQDPSTFVPEGMPVPCTSVAYPGQPLVCPGTPNPSGVMEGFMDTPVINGTAYPSLQVNPAAYRFQVLSVGNDRTFNLGLYYAADKNGTVCKGGAVVDLSTCTEVSMIPAVPPTATSPLPLCVDATATGGGGLSIASLDTSGNPLNGTGLPAGCWPTIWPTDGRDGGVPDPTTAGPPIIQIGTEGGLLPTPAVIPSTPVGYEYNRRNIVVLNVSSHGLLLGPAERADIIVDFSGVPAQSALIFYNDGPAPIPGFDPRVDYYTGDPDLTTSGGAPSTQPGYGPNTRTLMQIKVTGTGNSGFSLPALQTALPAVFKATQDPIIVPESAYNTALGTAYTDHYARIQDTALTLDASPLASVTVTNGGSGYTSPPTVTFVGGGGAGALATATIGGSPLKVVKVTAGGSGYRSVPTVTFTGGGGTGAAARATVSGGVVTAITLTNPGSGYTSNPTVTVNGGRPTVQATARAYRTGGPITAITLTNPGGGYTLAPSVFLTGGGGTGALAMADVANTIPMLPKTIQELFTLDYGRMNATLGVELPFTNYLTQTTIPYGYIDPPTEIFKSGETQIWKITHNGVDTHLIHFHLFTVQVVNRVGWDGMIKPPDPNELSWKDTVRMNPLEDVIVALRPMKQQGLPWKLPNSVRPLDVTMPVGSSLPNQFTTMDPTNEPVAVTNDVTNFGWEYVWHCHILGHEEIDMMRVMSLAVAPDVPGTPLATLSGTGRAQRVILTWKDNSRNETSFMVQRATTAAGPWSTVANVPDSPGVGRTITYTDTTVARNTTYYYRVSASNLVGYTKSFPAPAVGWPTEVARSAPAGPSNSVTTN